MSQSATAAASAAAPAKRRRKFGEVLGCALGRPKVAVMLALGFSSGLPFMLIGNTLGYWMREDGVDLAVIGFVVVGRHDLHPEVPLGAAGRSPARPDWGGWEAVAAG